MNKVKIKKIVWNSWNIEHIKKHKVTVKEVEEAYKSRTIVKLSYFGRRMIFGKTKKGRFLTIIVSFTDENNLYIVSARDMSKKERKIYESQKYKS